MAAHADTACALRRVSVDELTGSSVQLDAAPLIITGAMDGWPALSRWSALLADDSQVAAAAAARYANCTLDGRTLGAHVARARSRSTRHYRVLLRDFDSACPALRDDYATPPPLADAWSTLPCDARPAFPRSGSRDWHWLVVGSARSGTPWHVDSYNTSAWNALVAGTKARPSHPRRGPACTDLACVNSPALAYARRGHSTRRNPLRPRDRSLAPATAAARTTRPPRPSGGARRSPRFHVARGRSSASSARARSSPCQAAGGTRYSISRRTCAEIFAEMRAETIAEA